MNRESQIVLTELRQADGGKKLRPVLLLRKMPTYNDYLVCGISTQLHQEIPNFDIILMPSLSNRLRATSLVRLSFLSILSEDDIKGILGTIESIKHQQLLNNLSNYLTTR
jgi:mRNA interferase MazF